MNAKLGFCIKIWACENYIEKFIKSTFVLVKKYKISFNFYTKKAQTVF